MTGVERTIYDRTGGASAARLSAPAASQRPNCSCCFSRGCGASEGRNGGTALSTLPGRLRLLVPHVGSIDDGPEEAGLRVQLASFFGLLVCLYMLALVLGHLKKGHSLALAGQGATLSYGIEPD